MGTEQLRNLNVVLSSFEVQKGPAKGLQTLIVVAIEISFFFLIGLENALFDASTMFVEGVVTAGLLFLCVGSSKWTNLIWEKACNTATQLCFLSEKNAKLKITPLTYWNSS